MKADEAKMTGFVFKIQANMDPNHRDRIAFMRVCSGKLQRGMRAKLVRTGKSVTLSAPQFFFAQDRSLAEEAFAGDVVGIPNHGLLRIGDTLTEGEDMVFRGVPSFAPEILRRVKLSDAMKAKKLRDALHQMAEEGVSSTPPRFALRALPRHLQRRRQFVFAQRGETADSPALQAPGVWQRGKRIRRDRGLQRLLIGREFEVGGKLVGRQRGKCHPRLERATVKVLIFACARQREGQTPKIRRIRHLDVSPRGTKRSKAQAGNRPHTDSRLRTSASTMSLRSPESTTAPRSITA